MSGVRVGIDIGGTKTHVRAVAGSQTVCERVVRTSEWRRHEWKQDAGKLAEMSRQLVGTDSIDAMAVGAHGCDDAEECKAFEAAFGAVADFPVRVVNDAELIPPAMGIFDGIGVVAGTGSIAVTRNSGNQMLVAGGWGWAIGDEGSAAGLVREAGRLVSMHLDLGGSPDEPLVRQLCASLDIDRAVRIGSAISGSGTAARLGSHASAVFAAADEGSALATRVIDEGAAALAGLVGRLIERGARARHVIAGGGVITAQPPLAAAFLKHMQAQFGGTVTAGLLRGPPVAGACALAQRIDVDGVLHLTNKTGEIG